MTATAILERARSDGVTLWAEGPVLRYRGPGEAITQLLPELKAHKADLIDLLTHRTIDLDTVLIDVCQGVESMTPTVFRSLLSREDLADIEVGRIPIQSLRPYVETSPRASRAGGSSSYPKAMNAAKTLKAARARRRPCWDRRRRSGAGEGKWR